MICRRFILLLACAFAMPLVALAEKVHVVEQTVCGSAANVLSDTIVETDTQYTTAPVPVIAGWTFVYWTGYPNASTRICDEWGLYPRAVSLPVYGEMTLTAHYVEDDADSNGNGIKDWLEIYWNAEDLSRDSDEDNDGYNLWEELNFGTNPWVRDEPLPAGIAYADSVSILYNPQSLGASVIKSQPEDMLFATISNECVAVGTMITTPTCDPVRSDFAYWQIGNDRVEDAFGVAVTSVTFAMPHSDVEAIAVTEDDEMLRQKLFWHGDVVGDDSDIDGDGFTFVQEVQQGSSPTFANATVDAGVAYADTELVSYNPRNLKNFVIRSEPEGLLFDTISSNNVEVGTVVTTPCLSPANSYFCYWTLNGKRQCDAYGVALEMVTTTLQDEDIELVAVSEGDYEVRMHLYWLGVLSDAALDSDNDGYNLYDEIRQGTIPCFRDETVIAGIGYGDTSLIDYNPNGLHSFAVRSEPEGLLFDTIVSNYVASGTVVTTPVLSPSDSTFACWTVNGVRQCDEYGVALRSVTTIIKDEDLDIVAESISTLKERMALYWYGGSVAGDCDDDGDGHGFMDEIGQGTSPVFHDNALCAGVSYADSAILDYNPMSLHSFTIRSNPEGLLFDTVSSNYISSGTVITTPICDCVNTGFAYWTVNGERKCDAYGISLDRVAVILQDEDLDIVAETEPDYGLRAQLYWYGMPVCMGDDTDGDGYDIDEEVRQGSNPRFRNSTIASGVAYADTDLIAYNPMCLHKYTIRSDPEGLLFETISSEYVNPGTEVATPICDPGNSDFAYWMMNGVRQTDPFGASLQQVVTTINNEDLELVAVASEDSSLKWQLFWFGAPIALESDCDADGYDFSGEVASGTSPLFANNTIGGGVAFSDTVVFEVNLQPYEQVTGAVVGDKFKEIFTSPVAGNGASSETFGEELQPIVWDLNGDGLFDLVLVYKDGYKTFINVGYSGNPEFEERKDIAIDGVNLEMNSVEKLYSLALDVEPVDELTATTNGTALLVSDAYGRIWYYENCVLQHKVWGGSHAGFAEGLRLAAVDWEDDGDLDCLAGTADGKLMLLRDPKVGRPTNLKAEAGVDTVVLTWDPNQQSRIRGYRLYRADGESEDFGQIAEPQLPTYRDAPHEIATYGYKVSSVSRFYTAGNSTPTIIESPATEPVRATLGGVTFDWHDVNAKVGERVEVVTSIENALNYNVAGRSESISYDPEYLKPVAVMKSGITENIEMTDSAQDGSWTVTMMSGVLPAGSGRFLTFVFDALKEGMTTVGGATVEIASAATARYFLGDVNGDGVLDVEDVRLLAKLKNGNGRKWTEDQLKAGDFNANGKLDNADYQALRQLLKDKGVL